MMIVLPGSVFSNEPFIIPWNVPDNLVQGGKVKLMCSVSKGAHPIKYEWLLNGHNLYETNDLFVQNLDDASILNIKNLQLIHNSNISCVATNRYGKDVFSSSLTVNAAPQWVKKPPEQLNLKETETAQLALDCVANGNPNPRITWSKVNSLTKNSKDSTEQVLNSMPNGTLIIDRLQEISGLYTCTADNKIGEKLISKTLVSIQTSAKVTMIDDNGNELVSSLNSNEPPLNYARKSEAFTIRCQAVGDQPLSINWYKNGEIMQYKFKSNMETLNSPTASGLMSELHFRSIDRDDSGVYTCEVKNSLGISKRSQKVLVLEAPEPPKNLKISELDSNSVRVNWNFDGVFTGNSELNKLNIYYWESNTKNKLTGNHKLNKIEIDLVSSIWHVIKSLKSGTGYRVAVTCVNRIGESALSEIVEFETKMKSPSNPPTDLTIEKVFSNKILISWKYSLTDRKTANVTGFQVFYKPVDDQNYFLERIQVRNDDFDLAIERFHLTLVNLKKNTKYVIKVKSYNKEGFSPDSEEIVTNTLIGNVPNAPRIVQHQVHSKSYLIVKWEHSLNTQSNLLNAALRHTEEQNDHEHPLVPKQSNDDTSNLQDFENSVQFFMAYVELSDSLNGVKMIVQTIPIPSNINQVTITNLDRDVQYNIYIAASNRFGESEWSEPLIITIRSYQYESLFMAERNALLVIAVSIAATAIVISIICSIIYLKKFQLAQQEKLRKMSTLTLSKCGTNKTTATYATLGNTTLGNMPSTSTAHMNYNAQIGQMTPINTTAYLANHQPSTSNGGYQEIGLTYDLATGGLTTANTTKLNHTPHHLPLSTFGHVSIRSDASNTQSSDNEDSIRNHGLQIKDRLHQQSNKSSLDSMKNMRINYDELIYDDALG